MRTPATAPRAAARPVPPPVPRPFPPPAAKAGQGQRAAGPAPDRPGMTGTTTAASAGAAPRGLLPARARGPARPAAPAASGPPRRRLAAVLPAVLLLALAGCAQPSRQAVELAGAMRGAPPGAAADRLADQPPDCTLRDLACATLWLHRGAACARLAERDPAAAPARRDCAVAAFARALDLTPAEAPPEERLEAALRLADALERRRDRAIGAARRADDAAILGVAASLRGLTAGAPFAAHHAAGVVLVRALAGDIPAAARCAALAEAAAGFDAAPVPDPAAIAVPAAALLPRIAARRAALAAARQDCPP